MKPDFAGECCAPSGGNMRLVQFFDPAAGQRLGLLEGERVVDIGDATQRGTVQLVAAANGDPAALAAEVARLRAAAGGHSHAYADLDRPPAPDAPHLLAPISPPEVWACGVTYKRSAEFRDNETGVEEGIYDRVYRADRPELFFKATADRCVGPNDAVRIRSDSSFTAPEPELALVLDRNGTVLAYTLANDVSAWDIERDNPLYLPQSKIFLGCCSLGPWLVTADEQLDPYSVALSCEVIRGEGSIFSGSASTAQLNRRFEQLIAYLLRDNQIPDGSVLCTGTGIIVPADVPLKPGDVVSISAPGFGTLRNTAR
jgi:2-dehydro-3-deoxy-D-arabinonate dehydratase